MNERQIQARRRQLIIGLLQGSHPMSSQDMVVPLNRMLAKEGLKPIERRQVQADLNWLQQRLPSRCFQRLSASDLPEIPPGAGDQRVFYRIDPGEGFLPVADDVGMLTETEVSALITARGLLDQSFPDKGSSTRTPMADAIDHVIKALGINPDEIARLDILTLNQTAAEQYDPTHVRIILQTLRVGDGLNMDYQPLRKKAHPVIAQPIRMVLVNGEPYLWAWDSDAKTLKSYKVSRISNIQRRDRINAPSGLDSTVCQNLTDSFAGVVGRRLVTVVIRFDEAIVPLVEHRVLGRNHKQTRLPDGSLEVRFTTRGLAAVKHWLLQFGHQAVVIEPPYLAVWIQDEAKAMLARYQA